MRSVGAVNEPPLTIESLVVEAFEDAVIVPVIEVVPRFEVPVSVPERVFPEPLKVVVPVVGAVKVPAFK